MADFGGFLKGVGRFLGKGAVAAYGVGGPVGLVALATFEAINIGDNVANAYKAYQRGDGKTLLGESLTAASKISGAIVGAGVAVAAVGLLTATAPVWLTAGAAGAVVSTAAVVGLSIAGTVYGNELREKITGYEESKDTPVTSAMKAPFKNIDTNKLIDTAARATTNVIMAIKEAREHPADQAAWVVMGTAKMALDPLDQLAADTGAQTAPAVPGLTPHDDAAAKIAAAPPTLASPPAAGAGDKKTLPPRNDYGVIARGPTTTPELPKKPPANKPVQAAAALSQATPDPKARPAAKSKPAAQVSSHNPGTARPAGM